MLLQAWAVTSFILPLLFSHTCSAEVKQTPKPIFTQKPFLVIWNVPSQDCKPRYKIDLNLQMFDAEASPTEGFVRQKLTLFYKERFGLYPYYSENNVSVNGGLPQNSSLDAHLQKLPEDIEKYTVSKSEDGLTVIDWEEWRPLWIRNWEAKDIYRTKSVSLVREKHPDWSSEKLKQEAVYEFENAAKEFMGHTLRHARNIRPNQLWGYYLFPDCYNHDYKKSLENYTGRCPDVEESRNNQLIWLWQKSTAIYPSIYLDKQLSSSENGRKFVHYRVKEAMRVSSLSNQSFSLPVFVYTLPTYHGTLETLSERDLINTIGESAAMGAAGCIIWGDSLSSDKPTCETMKKYVENTLGLYVLNVSTAALKCSQKLCNSNGRCLRKDSEAMAFLHLNKRSFSIAVNEEGVLQVQGELSQSDMLNLRKEFVCQCYQGWQGSSCAKEVPMPSGVAGPTSALLLTSFIILLCSLLIL